jgi:hypothetical protein
MSIKSNKKHDVKKKNMQKLRRRIHDNMNKPDFDDPFMEPLIIIEDTEVDKGIVGTGFNASNILSEFCRPWTEEFQETGADEETIERLYDFAVAAWNQYYLKEDEKIQYMWSFLQKYEYSEKWDKILAHLMKLRETIFSTYQFIVLDNQVNFKEDGISITTTSAQVE